MAHHSGPDKEAPLRITKTMGESIASLRARLNRFGDAYVRRTPHIGAWPINNLICAAFGIPSHMVDTNVVGHDTLYTDIDNEHVRKVVKAHNAEPGTITGINKGLIEGFRGPLKLLFPGSEIITNTELYKDLGKSFDLDRAFHAVAEVSLQLGLWKRYVTADGKTHVLDDRDRGNLTADDLRKRGIFGVSNTKQGFIVPVEVSLMIESVLLAARKGADKTFELAGRDMHLYVRKIADSLRVVHAALLKELAPSGIIADRHEMVVTTTLGLRFAVLEEKREAFQKIISSIQEYQSVLTARNQDPRIRSAAENRLRAQESNNVDEMNRIDAEMGRISKKYVDAAEEMSSKLAIRIREFPDLFATGGSSGVPYDLNQFTAVSELKRLEKLQYQVQETDNNLEREMRSLYIVDHICHEMSFSEINEILRAIDFFNKKISAWSARKTPPPVALGSNLAQDENI